MYTIDRFRPGRQTMQNVKPTDHVPFEDVPGLSLYQSGPVLPVTQTRPTAFQAN